MFLPNRLKNPLNIRKIGSNKPNYWQKMSKFEQIYNNYLDAQENVFAYFTDEEFSLINIGNHDFFKLIQL